MVNGFWRKVLRDLDAVWRSTAISVYPDMNTVLSRGCIFWIRRARSRPFISGITTSESSSPMCPRCSAARCKASAGHPIPAPDSRVLQNLTRDLAHDRFVFHQKNDRFLSLSESNEVFGVTEEVVIAPTALAFCCCLSNRRTTWSERHAPCQLRRKPRCAGKFLRGSEMRIKSERRCAWER